MLLVTATFPPVAITAMHKCCAVHGHIACIHDALCNYIKPGDRQA